MPSVTLNGLESSAMNGICRPQDLTSPREHVFGQQSFDDQTTYSLRWQVSNRKDYNPVSLYQPYGVAIRGDDVFVAEGFWPYSRLQMFSAATGKSRHSLVQGQVLPFGVTVADSGVVAITDHKDRTVKFLSADSKKLTSWQGELFDWPTGIDVDQRGRYYVTDWYKGRVAIHDENGRAILSFLSTGVDDLNKHSCPMYVAVDANKRIVVSDTFDHSIKVFSDDGRLLLKFGDKSGPGKIVDPRGVCVDRCGNVVVADWGGGRVKVYSDGGIWIQDVLTKDEGIQHPWGVALSQDLMAITEQKLSGEPSLKLYRTVGGHREQICNATG